MALPRYLAQTREEFTACPSMPDHTAWMACHFSPYGTGLVNLPPPLPPESMVILNDRIPMAGHDPITIRNQLQALQPEYLLLDFQRPPTPETEKLIHLLVESLSCPTAVPVAYDVGYHCPLFLPLPLPDIAFDVYLTTWRGREIWLEIGCDAISYTVTESGAVSRPLPSAPDNGRADPDLLCHYQIRLAENRAVFELWRTRQDLEKLLEKLLEQAAAFGVTKAVGLWQELHG